MSGVFWDGQWFVATYVDIDGKEKIAGRFSDEAIAQKVWERFQGKRRIAKPPSFGTYAPTQKKEGSHGGHDDRVDSRRRRQQGKDVEPDPRVLGRLSRV